MTNHTEQPSIQTAVVTQLDWAVQNPTAPIVQVDVEAWLSDIGLLGSVVYTIRMTNTPTGHPLVTFIGTFNDLERLERAYDEMAD